MTYLSKSDIRNGPAEHGMTDASIQAKSLYSFHIYHHPPSPLPL